MQVIKIKPTSQSDLFQLTNHRRWWRKRCLRGGQWGTPGCQGLIYLYHAIQWTWCQKTKSPQDLKNRPRLEGIVSFGIGCGRVWVLQTLSYLLTETILKFCCSLPNSMHAFWLHFFTPTLHPTNICDCRNRPGVFTRVACFLGWIRYVKQEIVGLISLRKILA